MSPNFARQSVQPHSPAALKTASRSPRTTDYFQYVGCRGLLLQRFAQIVGALAQLVEQPRVLDGDHRLGGEVLSSSICLSVNGRTSWR